ncbi:MAG: hypothetical protein ACFB21_06505 [Opitutales bacterium]
MTVTEQWLAVARDMLVWAVGNEFATVPFWAVGGLALVVLAFGGKVIYSALTEVRRGMLVLLLAHTLMLAGALGAAAGVAVGWREAESHPSGAYAMAGAAVLAAGLIYAVSRSFLTGTKDAMGAVATCMTIAVTIGALVLGDLAFDIVEAQGDRFVPSKDLDELSR